MEKITGDQPDIRTSLVTGLRELIQIHNGQSRIKNAITIGANQNSLSLKTKRLQNF